MFLLDFMSQPSLLLNQSLNMVQQLYDYIFGAALGGFLNDQHLRKISLKLKIFFHSSLFHLVVIPQRKFGIYCFFRLFSDLMTNERWPVSLSHLTLIYFMRSKQAHFTYYSQSIFVCFESTISMHPQNVPEISQQIQY